MNKQLERSGDSPKANGSAEIKAVFLVICHTAECSRAPQKTKPSEVVPALISGARSIIPPIVSYLDQELRAGPGPILMYD